MSDESSSVTRQAARVFERAIALDPWQRSAFVRRECGADSALRIEVESLLANDETTATFLARPIVGLHESPSFRNQIFGSYRLLEKLGEGGMGKVFLAKRNDRAFEKRVAIKVLKEPAPSKTARARLQLERQILASLDHPGIARLLDGGTSEEGLPFFVMELIDGEAITEYCDRRQWTLEQRLELFLQVCEAVEFAHRNLIVHRDLKPGNILVTDNGTAKILDFGIAKVVDQSPPAEHPTATAHVAFTPHYASPEQIARQSVTTASDTFSLGVILFELLSGSRPFPEPGSTPGSEELARPAARFDTPPRLATAIPDHRVANTAESRSTSRRDLLRKLGGDLETIVACTLRIEPEQRYASVADFARDLRRFLDQRPIEARPPSLRYRLSKWAHRRPALASLTALSLFSALSIGTLLVQGKNRVERERLLVEQARLEERAQRGRAEQVVDLLISLFEQQNPIYGVSNRVDSIEALLDTGIQIVESELANDPETLGTFLSTIASVFRGRGDLDRAREAATSALEVHRRSFGSVHPRVASSWLQVAEIESERGEHRAALENLGVALLVHREAQSLVPEIVDWVRRLTFGWNDGVFQQRGRSPSALSADQEQDTLELLIASGSILRAAGQLRAALSIMEKALAVTQTSRSTSKLELANRWIDVATLQSDGRLLAESDSSFQQALELLSSLGPSGLASLAAARTNYSLVLTELSRFEDAEAEAQESVRLHREIYGSDHFLFAVAINNLGRVAVMQNRFDEGLQHHRTALEIHRSALGEHHPKVADQWNNLAIIHQNLGNLIAAEDSFRRSLAIRTEALGESHPRTIQSILNLANLRRSQPDGLEEAEQLSLRGARLLAETLGTEHPEYGRALNGLASQYLNRGLYTKARQVATDAVSIYITVYGEDNWRTAVAASRLGIALVALGEDQIGRDHLARSTAILEREGRTFYLEQIESQLLDVSRQNDSSQNRH